MAPHQEANDPTYNLGPVTPHEAFVEHGGIRARTKYAIATDPDQADRATEIKLLSFARPHMRAFHFAWLSFFIAFFGWFSIPPLMPTIKKQLKLTPGQVSNSNIVSVASTIAGRTIAGPMCDRYGSRTVQAVLLVVGAIPVACAAFANNYVGFMIVRFFIGLVGCAFVATAYWTSTMFSKEVVGTANALAAGWGNLGAGVTYLITPLLFDLVTIDGTVSDDYGWRITLVFPAIFMVAVGISLYFFSDDCPQGNYAVLKKQDAATGGDQSAATIAVKPSIDMKKALMAVAKKPATWILAFQYACSFGVELQVHNVLSLFYYEDFSKSGCVGNADECRLLTQTKASLISSLFGLMCIFARAAGGYASDVANKRFGMKGRLVVQFVAFAGQALFLYFFSIISSLGWNVVCLVVFGFFVQGSTGTTYGIVPYVLPELTGATSGLVGAGGNVGALCWGFLFKGVGNRAHSFRYLSIFVAAAAIMTAILTVDREPLGEKESIYGVAETEAGQTSEFRRYSAASIQGQEGSKRESV
jgi:NNP family nitrate/nitrite transporter-like MFS transporter